MPPRTFIVLATYNGARFLPAQLASIQAQTVTAWTLLVRDDGSTDNTTELVRAAAHLDPRIELVDGDRPGHAGVVGNFGRLAALALERGASHVFLADQDDVWAPDKMARLLEAMTAAEARRGVDCPVLAHSDLRLIDGDSRAVADSFMRFQRIRHEERDPLRMLLVQNFVTGCATAVNRALLSFATPVPDGVPMHDWWLAICAAATGELVFITEPTIDYRRHGANTVAVRGFWRTLNPLRSDWRAVWRSGRTTQSAARTQAEALRDRLVVHDRASTPAVDVVRRYAELCAAPSAVVRISTARRLGLRSQTWPRTLALYLRLAAGVSSPATAPLRAATPANDHAPPTIVIVNYNGGTHLGRCLDSVTTSAPDAGAIVIDNASSDGSAAIASGRRRVRLVRNAANVGFGRAVNQAVALADSHVVMLVNPDCELRAGAFEALAAELEAHPECAIVAPRVLNDDGSVQGNVRGHPTLMTGLFGRTTLLTKLFPRSRMAMRNVAVRDDAGDGEARAVDWVSGACMLMRRAAFVRVGGFDERYFLYWEDADLCRRLAETGYTTRYVPAATVVHSGGASSRTARLLAIRAFHQSAFLYYSTHVARGPLQRAIARVLLATRCQWKLLAARRQS